jgi:hypothetical protein
VLPKNLLLLLLSNFDKLPKRERERKKEKKKKEKKGPEGMVSCLIQNTHMHI